MARIVIAGCGDVGTRLGVLLHQAGHQVWGLRRNVARLPAEIQPISADLNRTEDLTQLPDALDYVFYTSAAGGFSDARYQAAYVDGVRNVLDALKMQQQKIKRFFFTSSTSVYAQSEGEWVDESSPALASGFSGKSIRSGETLCWQSDYPATVVRFGGIYGPGRTRLLDTLKQGNASCVEGVYSNRIHCDDCARVLLHLLQHDAPESLYLAVDDAPVLQCEVLQWLAQRLQVTGPDIVDTPVSEREGRLRSNKRCDNTRLKNSGFRFDYPSYREGYSAMLDIRL